MNNDIKKNKWKFSRTKSKCKNTILNQWPQILAIDYKKLIKDKHRFAEKRSTINNWKINKWKYYEINYPK